MIPAQLTGILNEWFQNRGFKHVSLTEVVNPTKDSSYELNVVCELKFQPDNARALSFEVWICDCGSIGFGIDRRTRIASLLGFSSKSKMFAGGKEPTRLSDDVLISILNLVADGRVGLSYIALPIVGLLSMWIVLDQEQIDELSRSNINHADYNFSSHQKWNPFCRILRFERWS